jgi:hypothetical protein
MGFVQASLLTALAAVVVPLVAHLFFRRRFRPVELGTLRFLKIAVRQDTRRRWLKRWLLLAMRTGCVVLLVLLFARPYRAETAESGETGLTVILIDRSASMDRKKDGKRLVQRAVEELPAIVGRVPARSRLEVAWFDTAVQEVEKSSDGRAAISDLKAPDGLTGGTDYSVALNWAGTRCESARGLGPLAVHIVTDLQRSGFGSLETLAFPKDVPVNVWDVGPAATRNVAVTEVRPTHLMVKADQSTTVHVSVLNARPEPLDHLPVRLRLANKDKVVTLTGTASAGPGASATLTFETPALSPGLWQGTASLAGDDALSLDDVRHVAIFAAPKPRVLLLDGAAREVAALSEVYFLESALRLAPPGETVPDAPFRLTVLPYGADTRLPDLGETDVLVAANVGTFSPADAAKVKAFLDRGGSAVVFGGENLTPAGAASYAASGLAVGDIVGALNARDTPFRIAEFAGEHPMLVPFADPQHGDLRRLSFSGCTRITPAEGTQVLARFRDGTPLFLERQTGTCCVLWSAVSVGREHGEWSRSRLFLPIVHQFVRTAAGLSGEGPIRELPTAGEAPGVRQRENHWEVRNLEPQESDLEACSPDEFAKRLGVTLASDPGDSGGEKKGPEEKDGLEMRPGEFWPCLLLLFSVLWAAEGLLANRTVA